MKNENKINVGRQLIVDKISNIIDKIYHSESPYKDVHIELLTVLKQEYKDATLDNDFYVIESTNKIVVVKHTCERCGRIELIPVFLEDLKQFIASKHSIWNKISPNAGISSKYDGATFFDQLTSGLCSFCRNQFYKGDEFQSPINWDVRVGDYVVVNGNCKTFVAAGGGKYGKLFEDGYDSSFGAVDIDTTAEVIAGTICRVGAIKDAFDTDSNTPNTPNTYKTYPILKLYYGHDKYFYAPISCVSLFRPSEIGVGINEISRVGAVQYNKLLSEGAIYPMKNLPANMPDSNNLYIVYERKYACGSKDGVDAHCEPEFLGYINDFTCGTRPYQSARDAQIEKELIGKHISDVSKNPYLWNPDMINNIFGKIEPLPSKCLYGEPTLIQGGNNFIWCPRPGNKVRISPKYKSGASYDVKVAEVRAYTMVKINDIEAFGKCLSSNSRVCRFNIPHIITEQGDIIPCDYIESIDPNEGIEKISYRIDEDGNLFKLIAIKEINGKIDEKILAASVDELVIRKLFMSTSNNFYFVKRLE